MNSGYLIFYLHFGHEMFKFLIIVFALKLLGGNGNNSDLHIGHT